jgi:hypothetical protein
MRSEEGRGKGRRLCEDIEHVGDAEGVQCRMCDVTHSKHKHEQKIHIRGGRGGQRGGHKR